MDSFSFLCCADFVAILGHMYGRFPSSFISIDCHDGGFCHVDFDAAPVLESGDGVHEVLHFGVCLGENGKVIGVRQMVEGIYLGEPVGDSFGLTCCFE